MWVSDVGWIDDVIATPWVRSRFGSTSSRAGADDRLGVGAGQHAQPLRQTRQLALVAHLEQQMLGAPGAGGQDHVAGGVGAPVAAQPTAGANGADLPQPVGTLLESLHRRHRNHLRPSRFREAEVVLQQGVLGAVAAARHAAAAFQAAGARRAQRRRSTGRARSCPGPWCRRGRRTPRPASARTCRRQPMSSATSLTIRSASVNVGFVHHAEHPLRLLVVRHQLAAPVGDVLPLRVVEERLRRHVQRVGVVQRAAAHPGAGQDHHVRSGWMRWMP